MKGKTRDTRTGKEQTQQVSDFHLLKRQSNLNNYDYFRKRKSNLFGVVRGGPWHSVSVQVLLLGRYALKRPIKEIFEHCHRILFALHRLDSAT